MNGTKKPANRQNAFAFVLFAATSFVVGILSLLPQTAPPGGGVDLGLHAITYAVLTVIAHRAFGRRWRYAVPAVFLYSAAIEGLQTFVPGRTGSLDDLAANAAGVLCGFLAVVVGRAVRRGAAASRSRG